MEISYLVFQTLQPQTSVFRIHSFWFAPCLNNPQCCPRWWNLAFSRTRRKGWGPERKRWKCTMGQKVLLGQQLPGVSLKDGCNSREPNHLGTVGGYQDEAHLLNLDSLYQCTLCPRYPTLGTPLSMEKKHGTMSWHWATQQCLVWSQISLLDAASILWSSALDPLQGLPYLAHLKVLVDDPTLI